MDILRDTYKLALEHWVLTSLVVFVTYTYWHYITKFTVLQKQGFKGPTPWPIIGNSFDILRGKPLHDIFLRMTRKYGEVYGFYFLGIPCIMVSDPDILKAVLVKDFDKFHDRPSFGFKQPEPLSNLLTAVEGQKWKNIRSILTPIFTSGKMKQMMFIMQEASDTLLKKLDTVADQGKAIDIHMWQQGVTMEVILSSAFGVKTDSQTNPDDKMTAMARKAMERKPLPGIVNMIPVVGKYLAQKLIRTTRFGFGWSPVVGVARNIIKQRRQSADQSQRRDLLTLMLESQNPEAKGQYHLTDNEILAQMVLFILGGYDTSSNILGLTCYNLAVFPEAQERVAKEISQVCSSSETVTYDEIQKMPYLEACIAETLRLYPPGFMLSRKVTEACSVKNVPFKKGAAVFVPVYAMHHDEKYWPEPEAFKPERFLPENKETITPFTYMPFGDGPRNCVAMRFAYMEMKTVLVRVLQKYRLVRGPETSVPIKVKPRVVLAPAEPILVRVERRN